MAPPCASGCEFWSILVRTAGLLDSCSRALAPRLDCCIWQSAVMRRPREAPGNHSAVAVDLRVGG